MNKKMSTVLSILSLAIITLGVSGCHECDDVKSAKINILQIRDIFQKVQYNRAGWPGACQNLVDLAKKLPEEKEMLEPKKESLCKENYRSDACQGVLELSNSLSELHTLILSTCENVAADGDPTDPDNALGIRMTRNAKLAVKLIKDKIAPGGTIIIQLACDKDTRFSALSPAGNGKDSRSFDRNSSRVDDLLPAAPGHPGESGAAGAASI